MSMHEYLCMRDQIEAVLCDRMARAYIPPPSFTADEWADTYRKVGSESSSVPGDWRTETVEIARGPMRSISDHRIRDVTCMAGAQVFKTTTLETAVGFFMHLDPCPILFYSSSQQTVDAFVSQKLDPMIARTPELAELWGGVEALEQKSDKFTKSKKTFPGGFLELLTMKSTANLRSRSAKVVLIDEMDDCQAVADGDTAKLAADRAISFAGEEKIITVSTPTVRGESKIEQRYEQSDMRKPYLCCPRCGEWDYLRWKQVDYKRPDGKADPRIARYICEHCTNEWTDVERIRQLTTKDGISWRQTKPFRCCDELQHPEIDRCWTPDPESPHDMLATCRHCGDTPVPVEHAGYWGWIAYHPRWTMRKIAEAWLDCQGNPTELRAFVNTKLGETWVEHAGDHVDVDPDQFASRVEPSWDLIPAGVRALTSGWDVQTMGKSGAGRLEGEIVGHGDGDETWSIAYHIIPGDPTQGEVWATLDAILKAPCRTEDGRTLYIQATCIDTGGDNGQGDGSIIDAVTGFAAARAGRRVWAVKGASETGARQPIWSTVAPTIRNGAKLHMVGTQSAKDWVSSCIAKSQAGPGFMHVPADRDPMWFTQMTNEKRKYIKGKDGRSRAFWRPRYDGARTEALDARVYAKAAYEGLKRAFPRLSQLIQSAPAAAIPTPSADQESGQPAAAAVVTVPARRRPKIIRKPSTNSLWRR